MKVRSCESLFFHVYVETCIQFCFVFHLDNIRSYQVQVFFFFLTLLASKKIWCHPLCRAVSWYSLLPKYFSFLRLLLLLFSLVVEACKSLLCPQIIIICYCFLIFMLDQCIYVLCCLSQNIMHLWFFIIGNSSSCSAKWTPFPVKKENEICKIGKMFFVTKWKIIQLLEPSLYANFVGD